jgi:[protein-PII] uridylyltransferase
VERFMRTYYMNAAVTSHLAEELLEQVDRYLPEGLRRPLYSLRKRKIDGVGVLYKGKINPLAGVSFPKEPLRILEFFRAMQKTRSVPTPEAKKSIQRSLAALGPEFLRDPRAAELFLRILSDPNHLRETLLFMHECRFLGRYIPEFAPLSFRVQRDIYHVYTVDIHLILAASVLPGLEGKSPRTREEEEFLALYRSIPRKDLLVLAILCHDIGKGKGHGHSRIGAEIVARIGEQMGPEGHARHRDDHPVLRDRGNPGAARHALPPHLCRPARGRAGGVDPVEGDASARALREGEKRPRDRGA